MKDFGFYGLTPVERFGILIARYTIGGRGRARHLIERLFLGRRDKSRDGLIWKGTTKLRLPPYSNPKYLMADLRYNSRERAYLQSTIREGDVLADIGANIGFYTLWMAILGVPNTKILAIEPNPRVYAALVENVRLNGFENVTAINAAIGERDGTASFGVTEKNPSTGSILATTSEQITVSMRTLASVLAEQGIANCDIIKIDVEGYEYEALMPYLEAIPLERWPRLFIIEHKHSAKHWRGKLIEAILARGYQAVIRSTGNIVLEKKA